MIKHIEVDIHFIKENLNIRLVVTIHIFIELGLANIFTLTIQKSCRQIKNS